MASNSLLISSGGWLNRWTPGGEDNDNLANLSATAFCSWVACLICQSFISRSSDLQAQIRLSTILLNLLPPVAAISSLATQPQPALLKRGGEGGAAHEKMHSSIDPTTVEALSLRETLRWVKAMSLSSLIFEMNAQNVVYGLPPCTEYMSYV
nr:hypothetical protein Iba_chr10bCG9720 [Ipomoea batatas]